MTKNKKEGISNEKQKSIFILSVLFLCILSSIILFNNKTNIIFNNRLNTEVSKTIKNNYNELKKEYSNNTLIVKSTKDFNIKNAKNIIKYDDIYIVTFDTSKEAKKAYDEISKNNNIEYVNIDTEMKISNTQTSKKEIEQFLKTCTYSNNNKKEAELLDNYDVTNPYNHKKTQQRRQLLRSQHLRIQIKSPLLRQLIKQIKLLIHKKLQIRIQRQQRLLLNHNLLARVLKRRVFLNSSKSVKKRRLL